MVAKPGRSAWGSRRWRGVAAGIVVLLVGLLFVASASAAEVIATGALQSGGAIAVPQGQTKLVTLRLLADLTGVVTHKISATNPATATVYSRFGVGPAGATWQRCPVGPYTFWADGAIANPPPTWVGAPAPYAITAAVSASESAPVGTYKLPIIASIANPARGQLLANNVLDSITVSVVPGDFTPPVTSASVSGSIGGLGWYTTPARVTLSAVDTGGSGLKATHYSLDGGATWTTYAGPVSVATSGANTFTYYSDDGYGNTERSKSVSFNVDTVAPLCWATPSGPLGDNGWYTGPVSVALGTLDPVPGSGWPGVMCSCDCWATCCGYTAPLSICASGTTVVEYRAADLAGNVSATLAETIKVDNNDPVIAVRGPADGATVPSTFLYWSAADPSPGSGLRDVVATLDGDPFRNGTVPAPGVHTWRIVATDVAGRRSVVERTFTVDSNAP